MEYKRIYSQPLNIIPPFSYSYQCRSSLLAAYIPVFMYSISFQLLTVLVRLSVLFIPFNSSHSLHTLFLRWLPQFGSSLYLLNFPESSFQTSLNTPIRLIKSYQIVSHVLNNVTLLLTFGLCSPVLGFYIALNITVSLLSWLVLIGRYIYFHLCYPSSLRFDEVTLPCSSATLDASKIHLTNLSMQLYFPRSHLSICKWPILYTSCLFVTLLSWEMAGDEVGWTVSSWVPGAGFIMLIFIWTWDRFLRCQGDNLRNWWITFSTILSLTSMQTMPPESAHSIQLTSVTSSPLYPPADIQRENENEQKSNRRAKEYKEHSSS